MFYSQYLFRKTSGLLTTPLFSLASCPIVFPRTRGLYTGNIADSDTQLVEAKKQGPLSLYDLLAQRKTIRLDAHQRKALEPLQALHQSLISAHVQLASQAKQPKPEPESSSFFSSISRLFSRNQSTARSSSLSSSSSTSTSASTSTSSSSSSLSTHNVAFSLATFPIASRPKGIYMFGDVGCGKTFLMDMFYECCPVLPKKRVHFHAFMLDVHRRIHRWRQERRSPQDDDPILPLAAAIAREACVLCFDEFQVTDVADAMILHRIFTLLVDHHGLVAVFTSNRAPTELYKNGLNRPSFLPFIAFLQQRHLVHNLNSGVDYRLSGSSHGVRVFHTPLGSDSRKALDALFAQLGHHKPPVPQLVPIRGLGRQLHVPLTAHGVARYSFAELCQQPLGAADYLALAGRFHTLVLDDVPQMTLGEKLEARRFITLVDALYEHKVKLICSAEVPPHQLFVESKETVLRPNTISHYGSGEEEVFAFSRAVSRLIAMQSAEYLESAHTKSSNPEDE